MKTVADLLGKWPTDADFARDIGIDPRHIAMMKWRNSLPPDYWDDVIKAAGKRGIKGVNEDSLARILVARLRESA